jgi:hypothetical protein
MNKGRLLLSLALIGVAILITIKTIGPIIGKNFTPNLFILNGEMATEAGTIIALVALVQLGFLILVLNNKYSGLKSTLLGLGAGFLLIIPIALKDLDGILKMAIEGGSYKIVPTVQAQGVSSVTDTLLVDGKKLPIPKEISKLLLDKYPTKNAQ